MAKQKKLLNLFAKSEITPSERKLLGTETTEKLHELILLEKLPARLNIPERDLSQALGISPTPMRKALRILKTEDLVEYTATFRSRVADPSADKLSQSMTVLCVLEALGGELACRGATPKQIGTFAWLNAIMQEKSETLSSTNFFKTDMEFHAYVIFASQNRSLIKTHRTYNAKLWQA